MDLPMMSHMGPVGGAVQSVQDVHGVGGPQSGLRPSSVTLEQAGQGFEALFLSMLMASARAGLPGDDLTGSAAVRSSMEMLDAQLVKDGAARANLGIAAAVTRQFSGGGTGR